MQYSVFGDCLLSDLLFPELAVLSSAATPRWSLQRAEREEPALAGPQLGATASRACRLELQSKGADGYVLAHTCTGSFHLSIDGATIRYSLVPDAIPDRVRHDVLGRVLAVSLHLQGGYAFHASAVSVNEAAIAFLAPKGFGKSTLSLSLARSGAQFVSDDIVPVSLGSPITVGLGIQSVRLRVDSASHLLEAGARYRVGVDGKLIIDALPASWRDSRRSLPLAAIYVLAPTHESVARRAARREQLDARLASVELLRHAKVGALLGRDEAASLLDRAATLARAVPVFELSVVRDLQRLPEVVEIIGGWHGGLAATTS